MLKYPGEHQRQRVDPPSEPRSDSEEMPKFPGSSFHGRTPFSKVYIITMTRSEFRCVVVLGRKVWSLALSDGERKIASQNKCTALATSAACNMAHAPP